MILKKGNMWDIYNEVDLFLITANSFVKKNGELVMGRGIAKEARGKWPRLAKVLGGHIKADYGHLEEYSILISSNWPESKLGLFQVKRNWMDDAELAIIELSVNRLNQKLNSSKYKEITVALNFPGIGNGNLNREDVLPIIERLPDNVQVWEF